MWKFNNYENLIGGKSKKIGLVFSIGFLPQSWESHMTWRISDASKAVPGKRITGAETCPASTQIMLGYSSSPKSWISLAFSTHGFHTTASIQQKWVYRWTAELLVSSLTCIGEVVLLNPHLPVGHHIGDDVFLWRVLVHPVCVFVDSHHIPDLLVHGSIPGLFNRGKRWVGNMS